MESVSPTESVSLLFVYRLIVARCVSFFNSVYSVLELASPLSVREAQFNLLEFLTAHVTCFTAKRK